jgi:hypothetical protein
VTHRHPCPPPVHEKKANRFKYINCVEYIKRIKRAKCTEQVPSMQVPSMQVPSMQVPSMQVPSMQVPSMQVPSMQVPSMQVRQTFRGIARQRDDVADCEIPAMASSLMMTSFTVAMWRCAFAASMNACLFSYSVRGGDTCGHRCALLIDLPSAP